MKVVQRQHLEGVVAAAGLTCTWWVSLKVCGNRVAAVGSPQELSKAGADIVS